MALAVVRVERERVESVIFAGCNWGNEQTISATWRAGKDAMAAWARWEDQEVFYTAWEHKLSHWQA